MQARSFERLEQEVVGYAVEGLLLVEGADDARKLLLLGLSEKVSQCQPMQLRGATGDTARLVRAYDLCQHWC